MTEKRYIDGKAIKSVQMVRMQRRRTWRFYNACIVRFEDGSTVTMGEAEFNNRVVTFEPDPDGPQICSAITKRYQTSLEGI